MTRLARGFIASCFAAFLAAGFLPSPAAADLVVESWLLGVGVSDSNNSNSASSDIVTNPFQTTLTAIYGFSSSSSTFNFEWSSDSAHFDVSSSQYLQQLEGITGSSGRIQLVPAVDSSVTLQGTFQYAWPSKTSGGSVLFLAVFDVQTEEAIVFESEFGGNHGLGPPFGTLDVQGSGLLLAGRLYELNYLARIDHFDPTPPGTYGEASGAIHYEINPVPEPSTLALGILGTAILLRRRAR